MVQADLPVAATYAICVVSVAVYAERRLRTPPTNRSSTRVRLYRQAAVGYVACTLALFLLLSSALQYAAMDRLLSLGISNIPYIKTVAALPAPLLATVLLTIWLPNVLLVRDVDARMLVYFKSRANIPEEVMGRAEALTDRSLGVTPADIPELAAVIDTEGFPDPLRAHLRADAGAGLDLSRYRTTRLHKLFAKVRQLSYDPSCSRFFRDYATEWKERRA